MTISARLDPPHPTLLHGLLANASSGCDAPSTSFVDDDGNVIAWRHDKLALLAFGLGQQLADHGIARGDRVLLSLPTIPAFVSTFLAVSSIGAIPSATSLPAGFGAIDAYLDRMATLAEYLRPAAVVTLNSLAEPLRCRLGSLIPVLDAQAMHDTAAREPAGAPLHLPTPDELVFIQATSGSTSSPKGVMLSHANLVYNCEQIRHVISASRTRDDRWVSWLPLNHDMGLIGGVITPLLGGFDTVLMSPMTFQRNPARWLQVASEQRATITAAPNFAYGFTAARARDADLVGIDLSSWRAQFCGAEPIHRHTVQSFVNRFRSYGLPADSFLPCYGLAEATLAVSVCDFPDTIAADVVDRDELASNGVAVDMPACAANTVEVVDCGPIVPGTEVRIADADGKPLSDDKVGRVLCKGPSIMRGYWDLPAATAQALHDGWLDTGDLGYLRDGSLRITGRSKDMIIIRGANYSPSDFEHAAQAVLGVRPGGIAAVGRVDNNSGTEQLHIIVETKLDSSEHPDLRRRVRAAVASATGVAPTDVHVVAPHAIPKTTSGKVQRRLAAETLLGNKSEVLR